jgi:acyl dehydratase
MDFRASYNAKDIILYALAIGLGSEEDKEEELRYVYERHARFCPVPTFCLALTFWADQRDSATNGIPPFPPPMMASEEIIPKQYFRDHVDLSKLPVLHTWQSIVWHRNLPVPKVGENNARSNKAVHTKLNMRTLSVSPKSIGTFVTSETNVMLLDEKSSGRSVLLCSMHSTALVLGVPHESIIAYDSETPLLTSGPQIPNEQAPLLEWTYKTVATQALLYRLASGDSNKIHVDDSASRMLGSEKSAPLLHGLCTLGIVFRAILKVIDSADKTIRKLEAKFTQPVFVGDLLCVKIWQDQSHPWQAVLRLIFVVEKKDTGERVVDCGSAELDCSASHESKMWAKL